MNNRTTIMIAMVAVVMMAGMASAAATNVTGIYDSDGSDTVIPGETYIAYNFTYTDNSSTGTNLTWFNITGWNTTATGWTGDNNVTFDDIVNITLWNTTSGTPVYIGHNNSSSGFNICVYLNNCPIPKDAITNIAVNVTLNTTGLAEAKQIAFNANLTYANGSQTYTDWANDTCAENVTLGNIANLTSSVYDDKALIKVNITSTSPVGINKSTVNLSITNANTSVATDIIRDGVVVNGTEATGHSIDGGTTDLIRVSIELQEGWYNFNTVYAKDNYGNVIANHTDFEGMDFLVNMSGVALNVTPDNPALQDDGVAPRTAAENATVNVTVLDKYGRELVFNTSDVNVTMENITLIKTSGAGTVTITRTDTGAVTYPNWTQPMQFNVSDTVAETITLQALDVGPEGLTSGSASQEFTPRIGGVNVYATDGEILADGADYELVYLQLLDTAGNNVPKEGITVTWSVVNQSAAGATVTKGTTTNASGIAVLNITSATVSGKTMTITGIEQFTGTNNADSATVTTKSGTVNGTNCELYVNNSLTDISTGIDAGATLPVGVLLKDSQGNLVVGATVTLTANTTATFADSTLTSASTGWANTTVTLPTKVNTTMIRAITGVGNLSATIPELNQTLNVTTTATAVNKFAVSPGKNIGLKNVPGTTQPIAIQLQDVYGNNNTTAGVQILVTTDNTALGNMTNDSTYYNNDLYLTTNANGTATFTYQVNASDEGTANLAINATAYDGVEDTITVATSGPTGLNLTVNQMLPLVGSDVVATAQLIGPMGSIAIGGVNITFTLRNPAGSLVDSNSTVTDGTGAATYTFSQTTRGEYTIKAKNDDYGHEKTNTTTYVGNATQMWVDVNRTSAQVNETIRVYAIFKDETGLNSSSVDTNNFDVRFLADDSSFGTSGISSGVAFADYTQSTAGPVTIDILYTNATNPSWNGSTVVANSTSVTFTSEAALTVDTITVTPAGPLSMNVSDDPQTFTAVCKNSTTGDTPLTGITVTWESSNTTVGTVDPASGASTTFTARANGTTTITATAQGKSDTVTVTVGAAGLPGGDINGDSEVNLDDLILLGAAWGKSTGETGYNAAADINSNGVIDIDDLILLGANWTG